MESGDALTTLSYKEARRGGRGGRDGRGGHGKMHRTDERRALRAATEGAASENTTPVTAGAPPARPPAVGSDEAVARA